MGYFANKGYCKIYAGNVDFFIKQYEFCVKWVFQKYRTSDVTL